MTDIAGNSMEESDETPVDSLEPLLCCGSTDPLSLLPLSKPHSKQPRRNISSTRSRYLLYKHDKKSDEQERKSYTKEDAENEMKAWRDFQELEYRYQKVPFPETVPVMAGEFTVPVRVAPLPTCSSSSSSSSFTQSIMEWQGEQYEQVSSKGYGTPECGVRCVKRKRPHRFREKTETRSAHSGRPGAPPSSRISSANGIPASTTPGLVKPWFWSPSMSSATTTKDDDSTSRGSEGEISRPASIGSCTSLLTGKSDPFKYDDDEEDDGGDHPVIHLWPEEALPLEQTKVIQSLHGAHHKAKEGGGKAGSEVSRGKRKRERSPEETGDSDSAPRTASRERPGEGTPSAAGNAASAVDEDEVEDRSVTVTASEDVDARSRLETAERERETEDAERRLWELIEESDSSMDTHLSDSSGARQRYPRPPEPETSPFWDRKLESPVQGYSSSASCGSEMDRMSIALSNTTEVKATDHSWSQEVVRGPDYSGERMLEERDAQRERDRDAAQYPAPTSLLESLTAEYRAQLKRLRTIGQGVHSPEKPFPLAAGVPGPSSPRTPVSPAVPTLQSPVSVMDDLAATKALQHEAQRFYLEEQAVRYIGPKKRVYIDIFQGDRNIIFRTVCGDILVVDVNIAMQLDLYKRHINTEGERNFLRKGKLLPLVGLKDAIIILLWSSHFQTYGMTPDEEEVPASTSSSEDSNISDIWSEEEEVTIHRASKGTITTSSDDLGQQVTKKAKKVKRKLRRKKTPANSQKKKSSKSFVDSATDTSPVRRMSLHTDVGSFGKSSGLRWSPVTKAQGPEGLPTDPELGTPGVALLHALVGSSRLGTVRNLIQSADAMGAGSLRDALLRMVARSTLGASASSIAALVDGTIQGVSLTPKLCFLRHQMPTTTIYTVPYAEMYKDDRAADPFNQPRKHGRRQKGRPMLRANASPVKGNESQSEKKATLGQKSESRTRPQRKSSQKMPGKK